MALFGKNILRGSSGAVSDYEIERSCRFNRGDDAGLEYTRVVQVIIKKEPLVFG